MFYKQKDSPQLNPILKSPAAAGDVGANKKTGLQKIASNNWGNDKKQMFENSFLQNIPHDENREMEESFSSYRYERALNYVRKYTLSPG